MSDCIFCQIVAGDAPCDLVHEDELTMTFMDLFPVGKGHLLVVPKAHSENLFEIPEPALEQVVRHTRRLALVLRQVFSPDGIGVHQLNGAAAGQTVFHYHMHLIPRWDGDPRQIHGRVRGDPAEMTENARLISKALSAFSD
jgi:histidine triad (HIT) family protein